MELCATASNKRLSGGSATQSPYGYPSFAYLKRLAGGDCIRLDLNRCRDMKPGLPFQPATWKPDSQPRAETEMLMSLLLRVSLLCTLVMTTCGCMDGPFYAMKRLNPIHQAEWRKDRALGPTFEDRLKELEKLETRIDSMAASEQAQQAERLAKIVSDDPSPDVRIMAIRSLARLSAPGVSQALNTASVDEVEKVRLAACKAWMARGGNDAQDMLLSMATADESSSVRQSAIECLSAFDDPTVLRTLAGLLDERSPAINYGAAQSLTKITGQDFGGDFEQWKSYVASVGPSGNEKPTSLPELGESAVQTASGQVAFPQIPGLPEAAK